MGTNSRRLMLPRGIPSLRAVALLCSLASVSAHCGGGDGECRTASECSGNEECAPPVNDAPVCGMGCEVSDSCPVDGCPEGQVCAEYLGACCAWGSELSSRCVPRCPEAACAAGETCDADGRCVADPCADGFACAAHFVCEPATYGADLHGCIRGSCSRDGDCDDGACVLGRCYDSAGSCQVPQLVP